MLEIVCCQWLSEFVKTVANMSAQTTLTSEDLILSLTFLLLALQMWDILIIM